MVLEKVPCLGNVPRREIYLLPVWPPLGNAMVIRTRVVITVVDGVSALVGPIVSVVGT